MLIIEGSWFKDKHNRTVLLRGVNLGGSTKVPAHPPQPSHIRDRFFHHRNVSFIDRPFPLKKAEEHFSRLRHWGFNCLRLLVTWEAVEHAGPGQYDEEYLDYLQAVVAKAGEYGFYVFIDPHQDAWSRFTGGDGAPGWTLDAVGLDMLGFKQTGAAIVHNTHGDPFPRMIWPTNYNKLAAATMFSLFFGGDRYAPATKIDGTPAQQYLQKHYIDAMVQIARRVKNMPHVLGFDSLNEPSPGYIGRSDLNSNQFYLRQGNTPTPWQAMQLGSGYVQDVEIWAVGLTGIRRRGSRRIDPQGTTAWLPGKICVWRQNGVWDLDKSGQPVLLKPDHFACDDFGREHMNPFIRAFAAAIRQEMPRAMVFAEHQAMGKPAPWDKGQVKDFVYAPHWYDPITLSLKRFLPWLTMDPDTGKIVIGAEKVKKSFISQLARLKEEADNCFHGAPTLVGETGIAFDLNGGKAYRTGNFSSQVKALDRIMRALEANLLNYTLWNYTADNSNLRGDGWNGEDLSLFSRDQQEDRNDPDSGARALAAFVRPHPRAVAGTPTGMSFDCRKGVFELAVSSDPAQTHPTEIYIPRSHYPRGIEVSGDGTWEHLPEQQLLLWHHREHPVACLRVSRVTE